GLADFFLAIEPVASGPLAMERAVRLGWILAVAIVLITLLRATHCLYKGAGFVWIFFAGARLDAGGDVDAPGGEDFQRINHVGRVQAAGDDNLAEFLDDVDPRYRCAPVKGLAGASGFGRSAGVEQESVYEIGPPGHRPGFGTGVSHRNPRHDLQLRAERGQQVRH